MIVLNRPLTPILRQSRCTLMYDVYWLARWWCWTVTESKYLEYNPGSKLNILLVKMNNESQIEQNDRMKQWTKVEQRIIINRTTITIIHDNNCPSNTCIGLTYYNPICLGINGKTPYANKGLFAHPASWAVHKSLSFNADGLLLIHQCKASLVP